MISVLIAADYSPSLRMLPEIEKGNYGTIFDEVKMVEADYKIVNFESTVASPGDKPIQKCGPNLQCSEKCVDALSYAGFNCATLANNHIYDYGDEGVRNTIRQLVQNGMDYVGGGLSLCEAQRTLYKEVEGKTVAIINCCEHEFSIATEKNGGGNPIDPIVQWYAIEESKAKADYVIVIVHGGPEHFELPSPRMVAMYRFFVDAGADAVINHHQHRMSGFEEYKGKPIFYGLGNFCFDWGGGRFTPWHKGIMVKLLFDTENVKYEIIPYIQCYSYPGVHVLQDSSEINDFNQDLSRMNEIIRDGKKLEAAYATYLESKKSAYLSVLEPYQGKLWGFLYGKGLLPTFIKGKKKLRINNIISCESHLEKLLYALNH